MARLTVSQKEELINSVIRSKINNPLKNIQENKQKFAIDLL